MDATGQQTAEYKLPCLHPVDAHTEGQRSPKERASPEVLLYSDNFLEQKAQEVVLRVAGTGKRAQVV